jgi:hypothetical protein
MTVFYRRLYANYISGFSLVDLVRTAICTIVFALKRKHHFREYSLQTIVKRIQNLKPRTRSDMCQSLLGIHPILSYIDTRKLLFLQKLCSLDDNFITKRIFMTWLFSYFADNSRKHFGFIPDIIGILYHYELSDYLVEYLLQGIFSLSKYKSRLKCSIIISHQVFCRNWVPGQLQQAWTNMSENCLA